MVIFVLPMRTPTLILLLFALTVLSCNKHDEQQTNTLCEHPNQLPSSGYPSISSLVPVNYDKNQCGYFPLSRNNYWVYLDSLFDNNGQFLNIAIDTLRFIKTYKAPDGIIWWEPNIYRGTPQYVYSTDTLLYTLGNNWGGKPVSKWLLPITSDSTMEWTNFTDYGWQINAYKIKNIVIVPAGSFPNCISYKMTNDINIVFKPGIGVLKYKQNSPSFNSQKISTLLSYHIE